MGVMVAGLLSLLQVIFWSSRPQFILLGKFNGTAAYRDVDVYQNVIQLPGIMIVRMDAPRLSFYNISWFREGLDTMEHRLEVDPTYANNTISESNLVFQIETKAC